MSEQEADTYTPSEAARILKLTPHRVRQMLNAGELGGEQDAGGRWHVPQRAVHALLEERPRRDRGSQGGEAGERETEGGAAATDQVWELQEELKRAYLDMGRMEGRLELTERTESTMREERRRLLADLERERERAERLQQELTEARRPWWVWLFSGGRGPSGGGG